MIDEILELLESPVALVSGWQARSLIQRASGFWFAGESGRQSSGRVIGGVDVFAIACECLHGETASLNSVHTTHAAVGYRHPVRNI